MDNSRKKATVYIIFKNVNIIYHTFSSDVHSGKKKWWTFGQSPTRELKKARGGERSAGGCGQEPRLWWRETKCITDEKAVKRKGMGDKRDSNNKSRGYTESGGGRWVMEGKKEGDALE